MNQAKVKKLLKEHGIVDQVLGALQSSGSAVEAGDSSAVERSVQHAGQQPDRVTSQGHQPHVTYPPPSGGSIPGASVSAVGSQRSSGHPQQGQHGSPAVPAARSFAAPAVGSPQLRSNTRYLRVHIVKGMAFMEHLLDEDGRNATGHGAEIDEDAGDADGRHEAFLQGGSDTLPHKSASSPMLYYVLHMFHRGQRFTSELTPAATDPGFNTVFHVDMSSSNPAHGSMPSPAALLTVQQPLKLVLTLIKVRSSDHAAGAAAVPEVEVNLVSTAHVEWRRVLTTGRHAVTVELPGLGATAGLTAMPVGVLDVRFDLLPATAPPSGVDPEASASDSQAAGMPAASGALMPKAAIGVPAGIIQERIVQQQRRRDDAGRKFFAYAKRWWSEYTAAGPNYRCVTSVSRRVALECWLFSHCVMYCVLSQEAAGEGICRHGTRNTKACHCVRHPPRS